MPECTWGMSEKELCQADQTLPNRQVNFAGWPKGEMPNNCGTDGAVNVFKFIDGRVYYFKFCV